MKSSRDGRRRDRQRRKAHLSELFTGPLVVATANVLTLHPDEFRRAGSDVTSVGRIAFLENSFAASGIDIIGVQEGRLPGDAEAIGTHYTMLRAGADSQGNYGVQVRIRNSLTKHITSVDVLTSRLMHRFPLTPCSDTLGKIFRLNNQNQ